MSDILYEFPLNEKIRTYLRIEALLSRIQNQIGQTHQWALIEYLNALFAILDILERGDLKSDLLKDLEKHEKQLVTWSQHPEINNQALQDLLQTTVKMSSTLTASNKIAQTLREDKFLLSLKQRFSIPGGSCCFDLPHLHHWMHQPQAQIIADQKQWFSTLENVKSVINLDLKMIRERGQFEAYQAHNGFYQNSVENVELLQIKLPQNANYYPTVSGHKHRFSIRFMENFIEHGKTACVESVEFKLATC